MIVGVNMKMSDGKMILRHKKTKMNNEVIKDEYKQRLKVNSHCACAESLAVRVYIH